MTIQLWTFLFVTITFSAYLLIAWFSRVRDTSGFYVAGRSVPAIANGMATAADWMSAASYLSMAGLISTLIERSALRPGCPRAHGGGARPAG